MFGDSIFAEKTAVISRSGDPLANHAIRWNSLPEEARITSYCKAEKHIPVLKPSKQYNLTA